MSSHRRNPDPIEVPGRRRTDVYFAAGVIVAVGVLAWVVITLQGLSHDLSTSNAARDALARQVQGLGASPVAGPPGSRGEPGPTAVGPSGPAGSPGEPGAKGSSGAAAPPEPGPTGPSGSAGSPGADSTVPGPQGVQGVPGADSTVPGPKGDQGDPGVAGQAGKDGTDGRDGSPPAGWTWTDPAGQSYTCSPVDGFDQSAPRYACTADTTAPSGGSPTSSGLLGLGLMTGSAAYRRLP